MAVIAHPGDEAFGFGGAIAQAAASGAYVVVLCATRGHFDRRLLDRAPAPGGRNRHYSNPTVWRNLDTVREDEMRRSVALLGVRVLRMLDYAEEDARRLGHRVMALSTATTNPARRLYERHGFRIVETRTDPAFERYTGIAGRHLLVKDLT